MLVLVAIGLDEVSKTGGFGSSYIPFTVAHLWSECRRPSSLLLHHGRPPWGLNLDATTYSGIWQTREWSYI